MKRTKYNPKEMKPIVAIAIGGAVSLVVGGLLGAAASYMMLAGMVQEQHTQILLLVMQVASMLTGGYLALSLSGKKNIWIPLSVVGVQLLVLLASHILLIDEPFAITWTNAVSVVTAAAVFVFTQFASGGKRKFKYRKV